MNLNRAKYKTREYKTRFASPKAKRVRRTVVNVGPGYGATAIELSRACACLDKLVNSNETV